MSPSSALRLVAAVGLCVGAVGGVASEARAQRSVCAPAVLSWAERCDEASVALVFARHCDGRRVVLSIGESPSGEVELRDDSTEAFRVVDGVAIAPVGRFEDWAEAPDEVHVAFDTVLACVERDAPFEGWPEGELSQYEVRGEELPGLRIPWALLGALLLGLALLARNRRRLRAACFGRPALVLGGLALSTFFARLLLPLAFFHQNGQGPFWVELALCRSSSHYGPGYGSLFGSLARLGGADPETPLVLAVGALMALAPPAVFLIARHVGAGGWMALVAALATSLDPLAARLARSESYYAVICPLLTLAVCAALLGARSRRRGDLLMGAGAAGLFVAMSAQVHPLSWVPSALVTLPIVMAPGLGKRSLLRFALATGVVGLIALLVSGPAMLDVIVGPLGEQWLAPAGRSTRQVPLVTPLVAAAAIVALSKDRRRGALRVLGVLALAFAYGLTQATYRGTVAIGGAHDRLYLGVMVGVLLAIAPTLRRPSVVRPPHLAAALAVALGAWMAVRAPAWVTLPTDALEQQLVRGWRASWTRDERVVFLSRAGERRVLMYPLYPCVPGHARLDSLAADELGHLPGRAGSLYISSSLCSTDDGGPACAAIDRALPQTTEREERLPARASIPGLGYEDEWVEVGLSRLGSTR